MYLEKRLIAMLDVLGFANRLTARSSLEATAKRYFHLINTANGHMFAPKALEGSPGTPLPNFAYGKFVFDTVVLVSFPLDTKSIYRFTFASILLMELFFAEEFPLRGSVGIGDFCTDDSDSIFLSDCFKRLRLDEANQEWSGCCLLPDAEDLVVSAILGERPDDVAAAILRQSSPLHRMSVAMKNAPLDVERWCLNWAYLLTPSALDAGMNFMQGDQTKHRNTKTYLRTLSSLTDDKQSLPPECSPAVIMKTMKARSGMRIAFSDKNGERADPGCNLTIHAVGSNPGESAGFTIARRS